MKTLAQLQEQFVNNTFYKGIKTKKNPMDLWVYQEIIYKTKPEIIIEIGCLFGGTTLFLAEHSKATIWLVDVDLSKLDERIKRIDCFMFEMPANKAIKKFPTTKNKRIMVIEDSSHTYENTIECLELYSPLVSIGNHYVVEDTICPELGYDSLRPDKSVNDFLLKNSNFVKDTEAEKYITWNPGGFLKRIK